MSRKSLPVRFKNAQGETLAGMLDMPEGENPLAFGVFASCFTCTKDSLAAARISRTLAEKNIAMLRFDHAGLGDSAGNFFNTTTSVRIDDILAACVFLEGSYKTPALLIGHSIGGTLCFAIAQKRPDIKMIATIGSPRDTRWLAHKFVANGQIVFHDDHAELSAAGRRFKFTRDFLDDMRKIDIDTATHLFSGTALVFHAPHDNIVSFDNAEEIFMRLSGNKKLIRLSSTASHMLEKPEDTAIVAETIFAAFSKIMP